MSRLFDSSAVKEYYLTAELRRAAMWGVGGCLLLSPIAWWQIAFVQNRNPIDQWIAVLLFVGMAAWLSQFLTIRVRVDSSGIYRRRLWGWDFWSWDEFESGLIRNKISVGGYVNPQRPWWRQSLDLGYLAVGDRDAVVELIRRVWVPDAKDVECVSAEFRTSWPGRRSVRLDETGVEVVRGRVRSHVAWCQVGVTLWRLNPDRRDFRELEIVLPGDVIRLRQFVHQGIDHRNWSGVSAESMAAVLRRFADSGRMRDYTLCGAPRSLEEHEARQARSLPKVLEFHRFSRWILGVGWICVASGPLWVPPQNLWIAMPYFSMQMLVVQLLHRKMRREFDEQQALWDKQREELLRGSQ